MARKVDANVYQLSPEEAQRYYKERDAIRDHYMKRIMKIKEMVARLQKGIDRLIGEEAALLASLKESFDIPEYAYVRGPSAGVMYDGVHKVEYGEYPEEPLTEMGES